MKTVAHLLPAYNPFPPRYPAGTELRVEQVSLRQRRYRPLVVCGAFPGQREAERIGAMEIRRIRIGRIYRRLFQKLSRLDPVPYTERMWRRVRGEDAALLHIHNEPKLLAGLAPRLRRAPLPTVVHVANEKPLPPADLPLVARFVACSRHMADWLVQRWGIAPGRVEVIYTGVDTAARPPRWALAPAERAALRARWGLPQEATVIAFAGRLVKEKGVAELLDAFALLRARLPGRVFLAIAGNVRESKDPRNEKAVYGRAMAARIAQSPDVRWVGSLHPQQVHDFLAACDLFALTSIWHDPFPTAMLEAAAAGLPIVGSRRGGIPEFVGHCPGARLVDSPEDPAAWAAELERLLREPELADAQGRWLRERVEREFPWERVAREFEDLYDRLL